ELDRDGERLVPRMLAGQVDAGDPELRGLRLERGAGDQPGRVARLELVGGEVEERDAAMAQVGQVHEALLDGVAEVEVDEADAGRVRRASDEGERMTARLEPLDARVVREQLHENDPVGATRRDKARDRVWLSRR